MSAEKNFLQLVFLRPSEPIFMPRQEDDDTSIVLDIPDSFYEDRFKDICGKLRAKFNIDGVKKLEIKNVSIPDISFPKELGMKENFSVFFPKHNDMAACLTDIFMKQKTTKDLLAVAAFCHDRINPYLYNYSLSVAMLHRTDTRNITIPNLLEVFPGKFVDSNVFSKARQEASIAPKGSRQPIILPREMSANSKEPEQRLAYFREDLGVNLHHWHWHLVYPTKATDINIVKKDRRGELFYYMHQQFLARYNAERFANNLGPVQSYDLKGPIVEGYFPKLERMLSSKSWPPRLANISMKNIERTKEKLNLKLSDVAAFSKNIIDAVKNGRILDSKGISIPLTEKDGIDILGNLLEASMLSPNRKLYGELHNMGHLFMSLCHDPEGKYLESFAVMGDTATAMRDPIFYRWHKYINDIFLLHKDTLPKYTIAQLEYKNVNVTDVQITSAGKSSNEFHTFWQESDIDVSRGLDYTPSGALNLRFTHLQHEPFDYTITVNNKSSLQLIGTARIFMAPRYNSTGHIMNFEEQRKLMMELDKFKVNLVRGSNKITRKSEDSSLTIPYDRTFRNLDTDRPTDAAKLRSFNFCGCGWPQHMLIPKGTLKGMLFDLFVMVSNYDGDKIDQDITGYCNDADSFCGIQDKLYPDKRSMGYPFDRVGRTGVSSLTDFLTPNMKVKEVVIKFTEKTIINLVPVKHISVVAAKN